MNGWHASAWPRCCRWSIETSKFLRRRAAPETSLLDARRAVAPGRAVDGHTAPE